MHNNNPKKKLAEVKFEDVKNPDMAIPASTSDTEVMILAGRINCRKPIAFFNPGNIS